METLTPDISAFLSQTRIELRPLPDRDQFDMELERTLSAGEGEIGVILARLAQSGGKRIRPMLLLYSGYLFNGPAGPLLQAAIAAECIHMASLIHDDVIDESGMRRNQPSLNKQRGNHLAVLAGNYLFTTAIRILSHNRLFDCLDLMAEAIQKMVTGEIRQAAQQFDFNSGFAAYYDRIAHKTAWLIKNCCESGALIAKAPSFHGNLLGEYGYHTGLAFQIVDDILDFSGDPAQTGKPRWEDITRGQLTLPVLFLAEDSQYGSWIREIIANREFSEGTLAEITMVLQQTGIIARSYRVAADHLQRARQALSRLPQSPHLAYFHRLADKLAARIG